MLIGGRNPILRPMHVTSDHSGGDQRPVVTGAALLPKLQWTKHANARPTTVTAEAARDRGANCTTLPNTDVSGGNDLPHSGDSAATVGDCVAMCANDCSCNVAVYVSDIKKCYIKHLPAATDPPGQGGAVHTAVQCTPTCPAPPSPPGILNLGSIICLDCFAPPGFMRDVTTTRAVVGARVDIWPTVRHPHFFIPIFFLGPSPPGPPPAPTGTLWKADVSAIRGISDITALFVDGQRGIRARYPE